MKFPSSRAGEAAHRHGGWCVAVAVILALASGLGPWGCVAAENRGEQTGVRVDPAVAAELTAALTATARAELDAQLRASVEALAAGISAQMRAAVLDASRNESTQAGRDVTNTNDPEPWLNFGVALLDAAVKTVLVLAGVWLIVRRYRYRREKVSYESDKAAAMIREAARQQMAGAHLKVEG